MADMIFGYISRDEYPKFEHYLEARYPKGLTFRYRSGGRTIYFFRGDSSLCPIHHSSSSLMLCEGIPIKGSSGDGYDLLSVINDEDLKKGFAHFVEEIVSNISLVFFKNSNNPKLYLSSNRAGPGRIYYRYINSGIAVSSSFVALLDFAPSKISHEAIYSILKYGFVPPPLTSSRDVFVVPPSHYATVDLSKMKVSLQPFFRFCFSEEHGSSLDRLNDILDATSEILSQLDACPLLSGGVDSTLLAHKMCNQSTRRIKSYFLALHKNDPELGFAKQTAESSGSKLEIIHMEEGRLSQIAGEIATSYDHPFQDISIIPTYYLMSHIASEGEKIVVDGTGGDDCFGFQTIGSDEPLWRLAYDLPETVKRLACSVYAHSNAWRKENALEKTLRTIAKSREIDENLGPLVKVPPNNVFLSNSNYDKTIGKLVSRLTDRLIAPCSTREIFKQRATTTAIIFSCGPRAGAKTNLRARFPNLYTLYPFLWKDVLEEQGRISWSAKVNNGIVKWPLKKLLESYMPHKFIYRKKTGFDPDFERYVKNEKFFRSLKKAFTRRDIGDVFISRGKFIRLVKDLPLMERYSDPLCGFLWTLLFIKLWMSEQRNLVAMKAEHRPRTK